MDIIQPFEEEAVPGHGEINPRRGHQRAVDAPGSGNDHQRGDDRGTDRSYEQGQDVRGHDRAPPHAFHAQSPVIDHVRQDIQGDDQEDADHEAEGDDTPRILHLPCRITDTLPSRMGEDDQHDRGNDVSHRSQSPGGCRPGGKQAFMRPAEKQAHGHDGQKADHLENRGELLEYAGPLNADVVE